MKFVCITYSKKPQYDQPAPWLHRIRAYMGVLEALARLHTVICIDRINYTGELTQHGVRHIFPDVGGNRFSAPWKLNRYIKELNPDIVLVQGMIFPLQVIQLRLQLGRDTRIIVQNHAEKPGRRHNKLFQRLADRFIDAYLFTAKEMGMEWVNQGIMRQPGKIWEVMEASSAFGQMNKEKARAFTKAHGSPVMLWVGRLDQNKDPLTVIRAFLKFSVSCPSARLCMIFQTTELLPDIERLLDHEPGRRAIVLLIGERPHDELSYWYNTADFILSGSHYEGSGVAVCEAMSCGCIPILTDILSFRMMTDNGNCGVLYQAGDETSLLSALTRANALDMEKERQKVLDRFQSALSFDAIGSQIARVATSL